MSGSGGGFPGGAASVQRRMDLRKAQKASLEKQIHDVRDESNQTIVRMAQGLYAITQEVANLKNAAQKMNGALAGLMAMAQTATWRSMAIQKLLPSFGITEEQIVEKANALLVEDFEAASDRADVELGLVKAEAIEEAKSGYHAVASLKTFLKGEEAVAFRSIRTRFEIGGGDTFKEVTEAVVGMKVGETRRFALVIQDKVDECELTLLGLRKPKITEEPHGSPKENEVPQS